ncbi:hypothetical protein AGMMS49574_03550 [Bacteroidia bacterium]|nr:hypothetical protein AGMMS49574_03550 [Bacteroidia bacterium]
MTEVKVNFYLKRNEEKADGTVPVLGRIRIGKSMVQFSAKVSVPVSLWDTNSGRALGKSKAAISINASLDKICVAIHSACKDLLVKKENVSAGEVKSAFYYYWNKLFMCSFLMSIYIPAYFCQNSQLFIRISKFILYFYAEFKHVNSLPMIQ